MRFLGTLACERIITDKGGAHTLIAVISNVDLSITPPAGTSETLPTNAVMPREWWIFSLWEPNSDDVGREFDQAIEVYWPNGEKLVEGKVKFKPDERAQYNSYQILGFPVGQVGKVKIQTWVEDRGTRITDPFVYYITVKHRAPDDTTLHGMPHSLGMVSTPK